jgi:pSer/pThr/pTyr-binding forkhead associated (FHA) protein
MATIFVCSGPNKGHYYPLGHRTTVIGRAEALPIQILDDRVSRKHMQVFYDDKNDRYSAIDLKSRHGVFINAQQIKEATPLADHDQIRIGNTTLLFIDQDFADSGSAMRFYKKVGERERPTIIDQ